MRVKKVQFHEKDALIVYLTKQESAQEEIQKRLEIYEEIYKYVAVFVSGDLNIEDVLTKIVGEKIVCSELDFEEM